MHNKGVFSTLAWSLGLTVFDRVKSSRATYHSAYDMQNTNDHWKMDKVYKDKRLCLSPYISLDLAKW